LKPAEFLRLLQAASELPKTSQPTVTAFQSTFRRLVDEGKDVLCITLASKLSGTFNAARLAADSVGPERIRVVDSGVTAMALGLIVNESATAARSGANLDSVMAVAAEAVERVNLFAALETLDYVHKGGRIGKAAHFVGSALAIKPIVTVRDGEVLPVERTRTWRKALTRLAELTEALGPLEALIVGHAGNPADAQELRERLKHLVPPERLFIAEVGPVLTTYAGPGAVATGVLVARDGNARSSTLEMVGT
jgi:DegV family protein with EDD domain